MAATLIQSNENLAEATPKVWRVAPGDRAYLWDECSKPGKAGCITINWLNDYNFLEYAAKCDIDHLLRKTEGKKNQGGPAKCIWQFTREIEPGHLVVANQGIRVVKGIGRVSSRYLPPKHPKKPRRTCEKHCHVHLVDWVVTQEVVASENLFGNPNPPAVAELLPAACDRIKELYRKQHPELRDTIEALFGKSMPTSEVGKDIQETQNRKDIPATTRACQVDARVGQGKFRDDVLHCWQGRCAVTGSATKEAIRASHIQPWSESSDDERLDPSNGIPLIATLDALFDVGLISFDSIGRMLVSPRMSADERQILGVASDCKIKIASAKTVEYLKYHRHKHNFVE